MSIEESNEWQEWVPTGRSVWNHTTADPVFLLHDNLEAIRLAVYLNERRVGRHTASTLDATLTRAQTADTWQDWKKLTDQATANANEWMARAQTAEAALAEAKAGLGRIRGGFGIGQAVEAMQTLDRIARIDQHPTQEAVDDHEEGE